MEVSLTQCRPRGHDQWCEMEGGSEPDPGGPYPKAGEQNGADQSASARSHLPVNPIRLLLPHRVSQVRLFPEGWETGSCSPMR